MYFKYCIKHFAMLFCCAGLLSIVSCGNIYHDVVNDYNALVNDEPVIAVTSHTEGASVTAWEQVISGTCSHETVSSASITVNGETFDLSVAGGFFSHSATLDPGENLVDISVTSSWGKTAVIEDFSLNLSVAGTPSDGSFLNTSSVTYTWPAHPAGGVQYEIQVAEDSFFTVLSMVEEVQGLTVSEYTGVETPVVSREYFWRFRVMESDGVTVRVDWLPFQSFKSVSCNGVFFPLADSGQRTSHDSPGSGNDENIISPAARDFTVNPDSTVRDNVTGLLWMKCPEGSSSSDCSDAASAFSWSSAAAVCENLEYAGRSNWRLPSKAELVTLVNYDDKDSDEGAFDTGVFPEVNADPISFWTSNADSSEENASYVSFILAMTDMVSVDEQYLVRCVTGPDTPTPLSGTDERYTDNGNDTVTDNFTKLIWKKSDEGSKETWGDFAFIWTGFPAIEACEDLNGGGGYAGRTDWRLPSVTELHSLVDESQDPFLDTIFSDRRPSMYWSSTTNETGAGTIFAFHVDFDDGDIGTDFKTNEKYVRCVAGP